MKIKFKLIILFIFLWATHIVVAQDACSNAGVKQYITGDMYLYYYLQYNGSPMLNADWFKGSFTLVSGEQYSDVDINYDIFKDDLLYFNTELRRIVKIDKNIVIDFWIHADKEQISENMHVVNLGDADSAKVISGFVFQLVSDSVTLYAKKKKLIEFDNMNYSGTSKLGTFYEKTAYYYRRHNAIHSVPKSKTRLAKQFIEHTPEIRKFIVKNKFSLKNSAHLKLIFEEINRLYN